MNNQTTPQLKIKSLKRQAHRLSKEKNVSKAEALQLVSKQHGYLDWHNCRENLLKNERPKKHFAHEALKNDLLKPPIIGFDLNQNSGIDLNIKTSYIHAEEAYIPDMPSFRLFLDSYLRDVISSSKSNFAIILFINIDTFVGSLIKDKRAFFNAYIDRYPRLLAIDYYESESPLEQHHAEAWIDQFLDSYSRQWAEFESER
jgi:hypothetical protein